MSKQKNDKAQVSTCSINPIRSASVRYPGGEVLPARTPTARSSSTSPTSNVGSCVSRIADDSMMSVKPGSSSFLPESEKCSPPQEKRAVVVRNVASYETDAMNVRATTL